MFNVESGLEIMKQLSYLHIPQTASLSTDEGSGLHGLMGLPRKKPLSECTASGRQWRLCGTMVKRVSRPTASSSVCMYRVWMYDVPLITTSWIKPIILHITQGLKGLKSMKSTLSSGGLPYHRQCVTPQVALVWSCASWPDPAPDTRAANENPSNQTCC